MFNLQSGNLAVRFFVMPALLLKDIVDAEFDPSCKLAF